MNKCSQCGAENEEGAGLCKQCGAALVAAVSTKPHLEPGRFEFATLTPEDQSKNLVTLLTCTTSTIADLIVSELETAGLPASNPDSYRMTSGPFELDQVYKYRVQIPPEHFEAAKAFLSAGASQSDEATPQP